MKTKNDSKAFDNPQHPFGSISWRLSIRSRHYKKLVTQEDDEDFCPISANPSAVEVLRTARDVDDFAVNRRNGSREVNAKLNTGDIQPRPQAGKEQNLPRPRRYAICEEMERKIRNEAGVSLRKYREVLVTRRLLSEMHLL